MKFSFIAIFLWSFYLNISLIALPAQIMIIHHGDKLTQDNDLSLKGKERAAALVPYFSETKSLITNGTPIAIYAATAGSKKESSNLSIQTVTPLATQLKIAIKNQFEPDNYKKMVDEIKSESTYHGKTVLICWEHQQIPEIARAFGAFQTPSRWHEDTFDRTWIITFGPYGKTTFQNVAQRLMFGDSSN